MFSFLELPCISSHFLKEKHTSHPPKIQRWLHDVRTSWAKPKGSCFLWGIKIYFWFLSLLYFSESKTSTRNRGFWPTLKCFQLWYIVEWGGGGSNDVFVGRPSLLCPQSVFKNTEHSWAESRRPKRIGKKISNAKNIFLNSLKHEQKTWFFFLIKLFPGFIFRAMLLTRKKKMWNVQKKCEQQISVS